MTIQQKIDVLITNTAEIRKAYPTVESVRHVLTDIPYNDLIDFAASLNKTIYTDLHQSRAYIIYSPWVADHLDSDIWLYSTVIKIKPAEIIEE